MSTPNATGASAPPPCGAQGMTPNRCARPLHSRPSPIEMACWSASGTDGENDVSGTGVCEYQYPARNAASQPTHEGTVSQRYSVPIIVMYEFCHCCGNGMVIPLDSLTSVFRKVPHPVTSTSSSSFHSR